MRERGKAPTLPDEYAEAKLGDPRRVARACRIAEAAARKPGEALPKQAGGDAALEATYRFLNNEQVSADALLAAHASCTVARAAEAGVVLVIHDTSTFEFGGESLREGLGPVAGPNTQGFLSHVSLCVTRDGQPLGVLGLYSWARPVGERRGKRSQRASQYDPDRESLRWADAVHATAELLHGHANAIHVMDREGDCAELFADLLEHGYRFVIRLAHDRRLQTGRDADGIEKLFDAIAGAPVVLQREVPLSRRTNKARTSRQIKRFPAREVRDATLAVRAQTLTIFPGNGSVAHLPRALQLNFVEVREVDPPEGEEPVLWRLATTEPIATADDVGAIIDSYCRRWTIEEFFKALKTGCHFEKLQLESGAALMRALAIYASVAWRLLVIRWMDRNLPDAPATAVLSATQLLVLRAVMQERKRPLPAEPNAHDALMAIAALGGHLKRNGPPGWLLLGDGFRTLLVLEQGWLAAAQLFAGRADL